MNHAVRNKKGGAITDIITLVTTVVAVGSKPLILGAQVVGAAADTRRSVLEAWLGKMKTVAGSLLTDSESREILLGVLLTFVALGVLMFVFRVTNKFLQKAHAKLESWRGTRIPALKIQALEVISADRVTDMLKGMAKGVRIATLVAVLYIFIPLVLSFFPWTRNLLAAILPFILSPIYKLVWGFISFLPSLFFIVVIVIATRYLLRFNRVVFSEIQKETIAFPGFHPDWANPTSKLLGFLIVVFAVVLVSPHMPGFGSPAFQGISIFLGVLLSLGSTAAIANMVAGAALTYMRPFNVGDRVKIADTTGDVVERTLLITRLRTVKNVEVTIPNAMVLGSHMVNFSALAQDSGLIVHTSVTLGYDVSWRRVHELLMEAAHATRNVAREPEPFVLQTGLNDFSIAYELNVYTAEVKFAAGILSELHQNIQDKFNEAGIEILSPHFSAIWDGNGPIVPDDYLPKGSGPKGIRILPLETFPKIGE